MIVRALFALAMLASVPARADTAEPAGDEAPSIAPRATVETYPLRIVAVDAGSVAVVGLGGLLLIRAAFDGGDDTATQGFAFVTVGLAGYAIGAPLVHWGRGNPRGAMRSALVRTGLPLLGATLTYLADRTNEGSPIYGAVAGIGVAMILDWTVLSRVTVSASPFVAPAAGGGAQAGIAGRF